MYWRAPESSNVWYTSGRCFEPRQQPERLLPWFGNSPHEASCAGLFDFEVLRLRLAPVPSLSHPHSLYLSPTPTYTHSLSLSMSHTHIHTHTHSLSLSHTHTLSLSLSPSTRPPALRLTVPQILHFEPSLDASGLRSDVTSSTKFSQFGGRITGHIQHHATNAVPAHQPSWCFL